MIGRKRGPDCPLFRGRDDEEEAAVRSPLLTAGTPQRAVLRRRVSRPPVSRPAIASTLVGSGTALTLL